MGTCVRKQGAGVWESYWLIEVPPWLTPTSYFFPFETSVCASVVFGGS